MRNEKITVIGAGPVGIAMGMQLHQMGFDVVVFEERSKEQIVNGNDERSVNITLSKRGMDALRTMQCDAAVIDHAAKVVGRSYHTGEGSCFVPYTHIPNKYLYSIKRKNLEHILISEAEKKGLEIRFNHKLARIDFLNRNCYFSNNSNGVYFDFLFGTDGANSKVRNLLHTQHILCVNEFVYKRIEISSENATRIGLRPDVVNIFPCDHGMLLSLPNPDQTHSGLMHIKNTVLDEIYNNKALIHEYFPHLIDRIDGFHEKFFGSTEGAFGSINCTQWLWRNSILLMGDAAHAMLPFYGQGTNCGLEDVMIISEYIKRCGYNIQSAAEQFQKTRPESTNAISDLSNANLKNLEAHDFSQTLALKFLSLAIEEKFPDCPSEYFRVSFTNMPYKEAFDFSKKYAGIISDYAKRDTVKGQRNFPDALLTEIYLKIKAAA